MDTLLNDDFHYLSNDNYSDQWELSILPEELWRQIILCMNYNTMKIFRNVNKFTNNLYILMRKLLVEKFSQDTSKKSEFNEKIKLINNRMRIFFKHNLFMIIIYNDYYMIVRENLKYTENAHVKTESKIKDLLDLKCYCDENKPSCVDETIFYDGINKLNKQNHYYPFNVLQEYGDSVLSDNGDVYSYKKSTNEMEKITGINKIREIIEMNELLSINGEIYRSLDYYDNFTLDERFKNIIKVHIKFNSDYRYYLDDKGNIIIINKDNTYYSVIETRKKIIEICTINDFLYALCDNMKLYIYHHEIFIKEYDLLNL